MPGASAAAVHPAGDVPGVSAAAVHPLVVAAVAALCGLLALSAFAAPVLVALTVALAGVVVAWGWVGLLALPSPRGTATVLLVGVTATVVTAGLTRSDPFLRWVPAALAGSVLVAFVHQLARRDGRPRLVESIASTVAAVALLGSGVAFIPMPLVWSGAQVTLVALVAITVGAVVELAARWPVARPWLLPLTMALGGAVAVGVGLLVDVPWTAAALLGVVSAGVSHAVRRVLLSLPSMEHARPQLVSAAASVLSCGVLVYVIGRVLVT